MEIILILFSIISIASGYTRYFAVDSNGSSHLIDDDVGRYTYYVKEDFWTWVMGIGHFADLVSYMTVNSQGDMYLVSVQSTFEPTLGVLEHESSVREIIDTGPFTTLFSDNNDHIFYSKKRGLNVVKPNSKIPIPIKNVENLVIGLDGGKSPKTDSLGNVYLLMRPDIHGVGPDSMTPSAASTLCKSKPNTGNTKETRRQPCSLVPTSLSLTEKLVKISKEALEEEIPNAELIDFHDDLEGMYARYLFAVGLDVWILGENGKRDVMIKKLSGGKWETMTVNLNSNSFFFYAWLSKDRIFILVSVDHFSEFADVYAVTLDNREIVEFPELKNLTTSLYDSEFHFISDTEGYAYFAGVEEFSPWLGKLFVVKPHETTPTPISTANMTDMGSLRMDCDNNLWIVPGKYLEPGQEIYRLKKSSRTLEKVLGPPPEGCCGFTDVFFNCETNITFVSCVYGHFIFHEDEGRLF